MDKDLDFHFQMNWGVVMHLCNIERFDVFWPQLLAKETHFFQVSTVHSATSASLQDFMLTLLSGFDNDREQNVFSQIESLTYWFETELEIHPLIKCILFSYRISQMLRVFKTDKDISVKIAKLAMSDAGYSWAGYLYLENIILPFDASADDYVINFLSSLRESQLLLMRKIDRYGYEGNLDPSHKLLLFVIENHPGITTCKVAGKIGKSKTTVRRMLNKLKNMHLIIPCGAGPKMSYRLAMHF